MTTTQSKAKPFTRQTFIDLFNSIARHKHRYEVFKDFIFLSMIELHNSIFTKENKSQALEQEYIAIVGKYSRAEFDKFCELFSNLIVLMQAEPTDVIGGLYMELELTNLKNGQFFSPPEISTFMAKILAGDALKNMEDTHKPFIMLSEPACGAGGMVLAFASEMMNQGVNPAHKLFVQCIDIDRLAGFMCYLQLSLWGIPAQIIIGDTLTGKYRESYYTTMYYVQGWDMRLRIHRILDLCNSMTEPDTAEPPQNHHEGAATVTTKKSSDPEAESDLIAMAIQAETLPVQPKTNTKTNPKSNQNTEATKGVQIDLFSEFDFEIDHTHDEATGRQN
jgi:hypothetical protein